MGLEDQRGGREVPAAAETYSIIGWITGGKNMAVKKTVKAAEVKAEKAMEEIVSEPVKKAEKAEAPAAKEEPKKTAGRKTAVRKTTVKKETTTVKKAAAAAKGAVEKTAEPVKKALAKAAKAEVKTTVFVQFGGKETSVETLVDEAKKAYAAAGHKESEIKTLELYVKPEEQAAYYVVNGEGSDDYKIVY